MADAELDHFAKRTLQLALASLLALVAASLVLWLIATPNFVTDRGWWAWNGWPAVAGLGQILAAGATLGTLVFFAIQLAMLRRQAMRETEQRAEDIKRETVQRRDDIDRQRRQRREDYEQENTPVLAVLADAGRPSINGEVATADCNLVASGNGVAYNAIVNFWVGPESPTNLPSTQGFPAMRAPGEKPIKLSWRISNQRQWVRIEVRFMSMFRKPIGYVQTGYVETERGLATTEPPAFFEGSVPGPALSA